MARVPGPTPLSEAVRQDIAQLYEEKKIDYLAGLSLEEKKACLAKTSYKDYLLRYVKLHPEAVPFSRLGPTRCTALASMPFPRAIVSGSDTPALRDWAFPAAPCREWDARPCRRTTRNRISSTSPNGNASIARLLVRAMLPKVAGGRTMEDVVTARFDYAAAVGAESRRTGSG